MRTLITAALCLTLTACAGANYRPLVDSQGVNMSNYESDLGQCQQYAGQVAGAGEQAAIGAGLSALLGAAIAIAGGRGYDRGASAAMSGVAGGAAGAMSGEQDQRNVIRRCMAGRGYRVLQ